MLSCELRTADPMGVLKTGTVDIPYLCVRVTALCAEAKSGECRWIIALFFKGEEQKNWLYTLRAVFVCQSWAVGAVQQ